MKEGLTLAFDRSPLADRPLFQKFLTVTPDLDPPSLTDSVRVLARKAWEDRTESEYVGVMVVRHLHGLLVDLNAPMDVQEAALVMLQDEQRHTALCRDAAVSLGSTGEIDVPVDRMQMRRTEASVEDQLLDMVLGTYAIGEVTALALLRHTLGVLPDTGYRAILRRIAEDEGLHARFGPLVAQSMAADGWFRWPGQEAALAIVDRHQRAMAARQVVEPEELHLFTDPDSANAMLAVGIPDPAGFRAAYDDGLERAVRQIRSVLTH